MEEYKEWNFEKLVTEYLSHSFFFERDCILKDIPMSLQIEIKRIVSVLNAFTTGNYEADSKHGKHIINEAFREGFHLGDNLCTDEQLADMRSLFPVIDDMFDEFEYETPRICEFYRHLFTVYQASYNYITVFDNLRSDLYTDEFLVFDAFKRTKINSHIIEQVKTIYKAFEILLGDMVNKTLTTMELVEKYNYPAETNVQLEEYDKRWCRYYGYKYKDFIKPNNYLDKFNNVLSRK